MCEHKPCMKDILEDHYFDMETIEKKMYSIITCDLCDSYKYPTYKHYENFDQIRQCSCKRFICNKCDPYLELIEKLRSGIDEYIEAEEEETLSFQYLNTLLYGDSEEESTTNK